MIGSSAKEADEQTVACSSNRWRLAALIVIFFLTLLPILVAGSRYFGDEHFYTDGAIRMVQKGDYFTPYYVTDDGLPHFNKPILTYWAAAVSYKIFGISFFSSRLPFLIAGCLLILVTFQTSLMLFHRSDEALVAAGVILSNFYLFSTSVRSDPDVLQCLFLSVSLYGFMDILFNRNKTALNYVFGYVGAGLAVQTKGIPGVFPIVYAFVFCLLFMRRQVKLTDLINAKSMAAGAFLALFWFVVVYHIHGSTAWKGFYGDQVSSNLKRGIPFVANCWKYMQWTVSQLLPWSALLLLGLCLDTKIVRRFFKEYKLICGFIGGWFLVMLFTFCLTSFPRGRYMFPAYPLLAVVISALLVRTMREGRSARVYRIAFWLLLPIGAVYGIALLLAGAFISWRIVVGGILALSVSAVLLAMLRRNPHESGFVALGVMMFLLFSVQDIFVRPVFDISPAPMMTERLLQLRLQGTPITGVGLERYTLGNIKVLSGGQLDGQNLSVRSGPEELERHPVLLISQSVKKRLRANGYSIEECGYTLKPFRMSDFWSMIRHRNKDAVFAAKKIPYFIAIRATM